MRELREKVQKLRTYQVLKSFNFLQLTHLAQFYQQKTITYKDYLYKEGSTPQQIYLIQEGQFQFTKFLQDNGQNQIRTKLKQKMQRKNNLSKQKKIPTDFQQTTYYNHLKSSKLKQFKVGTILGGLGQSIGDEEIVLDKKLRAYNAKCMSTNNNIIVIKKQHILKILNDNQHLWGKLKFQFSEKQKITQKAHQKLQSVRTNMESWVKLLQKQTLREQTNARSTNRLPIQKLFKLPSLDRRNITQMTQKKGSLKEKSMIRASNDSLLDRSQQFKSKTYHIKSQVEDNGETFALTAFENKGSEIKRNFQTKLSKLEFGTDNSRDSEEYVKLISSKSQNEKLLSPRKMLSKQKYSGMVDSTDLVQQKEHIVGMRKNHSQISDRTEFQQRHKHLWKQALLEKQKAKQSSTAHSKQFMEKMLLTALRKAGYEEAIPQLKKNTEKTEEKTIFTEDEQYQTQDMQNSSNDTQNFKLDKITMKMKKKRKAFFEPISEILESNPFDECYFGKIN